MRLFLIGIIALMVVGCTLPAKYATYPAGKPIRVTAGYTTREHTDGDEFVFSTVLPLRDDWSYSTTYPTEKSGRINASGGKSNRELKFEWIWISKSSPETENTIKEKEIYLPWYSDKKGDGTRISYTPTERQIKSGDWYSVGYPQKQFHQSMYKSSKKYYCVRSVFRRGGRTTWDQEHGAPDGASYSIYDTCPFRTTDGRDAYFKITSGFWVSKEEFAANPKVLDEKLAALDEFLQPSWDSLEVMPQAYQFDVPPVDK
jgi:hypothetical protein